MCHGMMGLVLVPLPSKDTPAAGMDQHMKEMPRTQSLAHGQLSENGLTLSLTTWTGATSHGPIMTRSRGTVPNSHFRLPLKQQQTLCQAFIFWLCLHSYSYEKGLVTLCHWCGFCMFASNTHSMHTVRQCNSKKANIIVTSNKPGKYPPPPKPDQLKN